MRKIVAYTASNESIEAVVAGLAPTDKDCVLAVAGGGDQAFGLLEKSKNVVCVDNVSHQVELVRHRADSLRRGDYNEFVFYPGYIGSESTARDFKRNMLYFGEPGRMERIRLNLDGLSVVRGDVFEMGGFFDKVYLSNSLGYSDSVLVEQSSMVSGLVRIDGLVYISEVVSAGLVLADGGFVVDYKKTLKSRAIEQKDWRREKMFVWDPLVLRRVS